MTGAEIVSDIVNIMVSGITGIGQGIGSGLSAIMQSIFIAGTGENETLSVFGTLIIVFAALSLGFTLCRWAVNFLTSLGNRNR